MTSAGSWNLSTRGRGPRSSSDSLGLGLSIVAAIVDAHHVVLSLRPIPQGGLDVTVTLDATPDAYVDQVLQGPLG